MSRVGEADSFASHVIAWQQVHGRNGLPWQGSTDPYRVWLSEIMLQQTQVVTVVAYFERFLARFPTLQTLASAQLDEVLGLWSGLGYYTRATNLHRCAQSIVQQHGGHFPRTAAELENLPGIGRSTAAAIASICFEQRVAILDANVKRVLARVAGFDADIAQARNLRALWDVAAGMLPSEGSATAARPMARYTQGMMDLGATVCLPKQPLCSDCPVADRCVAKQMGKPQQYPVNQRKVKRSAHSYWLLWIQTPTGAVWLSQRPSSGIWAKLYCLPVFGSETELLHALPLEWRPFAQALPTFQHALTHRQLHLHPWRVKLPVDSPDLGDAFVGKWVAADAWPALGLPAPIRSLLEAQILVG